MKRIKPKRFGGVVAFAYRNGPEGDLLPGVSVNLNPNEDGDDDSCPIGEWLRVREARALHRNLTRALDYLASPKSKVKT